MRILSDGAAGIGGAAKAHVAGQMKARPTRSLRRSRADELRDLAASGSGAAVPPPVPRQPREMAASPAPGAVGGSAEIREPASTAAGSEFDASRYATHVEDLDLTDVQQRELLETLWSILATFVDLGFDVGVGSGLLPWNQVSTVEPPNGVPMTPTPSQGGPASTTSKEGEQ